MQRVTPEYSSQMKKPIRNRGYIQVEFGVENHKIQNSASVSNESVFAYYTNNTGIFEYKSTPKVKYATFEKNYTKIDGTTHFLPRQGLGANYYDSGLVSWNLISDINYYDVVINTPAYEFKGFTLDFGSNAPKNFDIITENTTIEIRDNAENRWETQDIIQATHYVRIRVYEMQVPENRFRISYVLFGYGLTYGNDFVIDSSLNSYASPVGLDIPQIDFRVVLNNENYFNVDDPKSAINYLETGQEINVRYGLQVDDEDEENIEWVQGCKLECSSWEADDTTATIYAQDIFRSMDSQYYSGKYESNSVSYYDLADDVLSDANITNYYIDPLLKTMHTKNPIPLVAHKEALQIIANACRCALTQTRDGTVSIKSNNFKPTVSITSNGATSYSNVQSVLNNTPKPEYATFAKDYTKLDNSMYFLPQYETPSIAVGYVSMYQSDENSEFQTNPTLTITQDSQHAYSNVRIIFGNSKPSEFIIETYNDNDLVETLSFPNEDYTEIEQDMSILYEFKDFDKMVIEFVKTETPYNRISVKNILLDDTHNFVMELNDILTSPKAIKQERVQEVIVPYCVYQESNEEVSIHKETLNIQTIGTKMVFSFPEPYYGYTVTLDGSDSHISVSDPDFCWRLEVTINATGTHELEIKGYKYNVTEKQVSHKIYESGKEGTTKVWKNPLIDNENSANALCEWLCEYYKSNIDYEYQIRGYPELDINDIIHQERKVKNEIKMVDVDVYRHNITFNGSFGGFIAAKRLRGEEQ